MVHRKSYLGLMMIAVLSLMPLSAQAISLEEAKQQGLVGERLDGYLGIVGASSPDVVTLVKAINNARRSEYQRIAAQNGQNISVIEKLAAEKAYAKTGRGLYVQDPSGGWHKQ